MKHAQARFHYILKNNFSVANKLLPPLLYGMSKRTNIRTNERVVEGKWTIALAKFSLLSLKPSLPWTMYFFTICFYNFCFAHLMRFTYISTSQQLQWKHRQFLEVNKSCCFSRSLLLLLWEIFAKLMLCQTIKILLSLPDICIYSPFLRFYKR